VEEADLGCGPEDRAGAKDANTLHQEAKGTSFFDERLIELQKEYAQQLLGHLNPYTKLKYTDDPAVAIVEINNENSIDVGYVAPSPFYAHELTSIYNSWLAKHRSPEQVAKLRTIGGVGSDVPYRCSAREVWLRERRPNGSMQRRNFTMIYSGTILPTWRAISNRRSGRSRW